MSVGVVDLLEMVNVEQHQRQRRLIAVRPLHLIDQGGTQLQPVVEASERVRGRLDAQSPRELLKLQQIVQLNLVMDPARFAQEINQGHDRNQQSDDDAQKAGRE